MENTSVAPGLSSDPPFFPLDRVLTSLAVAFGVPAFDLRVSDSGEVWTYARVKMFNRTTTVWLKIPAALPMMIHEVWLCSTLAIDQDVVRRALEDANAARPEGVFLEARQLGRHLRVTGYSDFRFLLDPVYVHALPEAMEAFGLRALEALTEAMYPGAA